jgi:hypothetical protein
MKQTILATVLAFSLTGCPGPGGKVDPWLTARTIITQTQTAMALSDGIFNQWKLTQPEDKAKEAEAKYLKIRNTVLNSLQLALDSVDIAEQAKKDLDIKKLMEKANAAWADLQKLLSDLLGGSEQPASMPFKGVKPGSRLRDQLNKLPPKLFKGV